MNILRSLVLVMAGAVGLCSAQLDLPIAMEGESPAGLFGPAADTQLMEVSAQSSVASYQKGKPFHIALHATIAAPWHAYFRNPGTVGEPMAISFHAPAGFSVRGPFWSVPVKHVSSYDSVAYSYDKPTIIWEITPTDAAPAEGEFSIQTTAQLCSDQGCNPPMDCSATVKLAAGDGAAAADWKPELLQQAVGLTPTPEGFSATQNATSVTLQIPAAMQAKEVYFFSDDNCIDPKAEQKLDAAAGKLTLKRNDNTDPMHPAKDTSIITQPIQHLRGVIVVNGRGYELDITVPGGAAPATPTAGAAPVAPASPELTGGLIALFASLFLGGLILNLMPCVFPVIGLKVMSFVELGGGSRRKVFLHSLFFVLGILISFWIISLLLLIFSNLEAMSGQPWTEWLSTLWNDSGSASRSWAAWMQNSWIVYIILLLLLALGLSMFGVFEIGVGATSAGQNMQNKGGLTGSFFQGLFVTVVATPCSAPFLGSALPAAMALPGVWMLTALTFMALGLAFPYIILGIFPALVKFLPKPGAWMESLKQGLSFLLFAAAAWFLFVYLAFMPEDQPMASLSVFVGLVVFSSAFWVYGRWCPMYQSRTSRIVGFIVALILGIAGFIAAMPKSSETPAENTSAEVTVEAPEWEDWSQELMDEALEEGSPVYVDFTAKWCATCLANKGVAYSNEVYAEMARAGVRLMRADKTKPSPAIDEAMRKLNRSSVPVNALYLPDEEPIVTRELLTADYLLDFLKQHLPTDEEIAAAEEAAEEEATEEEYEEEATEEEAAEEEAAEEEATEEEATEEEATEEEATEEEATEEEATEEEATEEEATEEEATEEEATEEEATEEEATEEDASEEEAPAA